MSAGIRAAAAALAAMMMTASALAASTAAKSEIGRGFAATNSCVAAHIPNTAPMAQCIRDAAANAEKSGADVRAFELGLFYAACINFDALVQTDTALSPVNKITAADLPVARAEFSRAYKTLRLRQQQLGVSDEQLIDSTPIIAFARAQWLSRLHQWATASR
jgi:hypothetical protein